MGSGKHARALCALISVRLSPLWQIRATRRFPLSLHGCCIHALAGGSEPLYISLHHLDYLATHRFGLLKFNEHAKNKTPSDHRSTPAALPTRNLYLQARPFMVNAATGFEGEFSGPGLGHELCKFVRLK